MEKCEREGGREGGREGERKKRGRRARGDVKWYYASSIIICTQVHKHSSHILRQWTTINPTVIQCTGHMSMWSYTLWLHMMTESAPCAGCSVEEVHVKATAQHQIKSNLHRRTRRRREWMKE